MPSSVRKICLLGDGAVGKTSLIRRFVHDKFSDEYITTFGTKVSKKVVDTDDGGVALMIWDILGQKKHGRLHSAYYKGASGAMIVCDLTRRETFESVDEWMSTLRDVAGNVPIILIGNKCDLEDQRTVMESALEKKAYRNGAVHFLSSAKTGINVEEAFKTIAKRIRDKEDRSREE